MSKNANKFQAVWALVLLISLPIYGQQTPFRGVPSKIPGIIEAEDYDLGGEGIAYHDVDLENQGGAYRPREAVDVETSSEHGYNIGWIQPGEWVEYTVDVQTAGVYRIDVRTAAESAPGAFHLELDRFNLTGTVTAPVTRGWQTWTTVSIPNIFLRQGQGVLRLYMESANFNVNYLQFTLVKVTQPPTVTLTSPLDGARLFAGDVVTLSASASDPDGTVRYVEFFVDGTLIAKDTDAPYAVEWRPKRTGKCVLQARAADNDGGSALSQPVTVEVKFPNYSPGPNFSVERGFYEKPFDLQISTDIPGAVIRYSLDCSNPVASPTAKQAGSTVVVRIDPQSRTDRGDTPGVIVRAVAVKDGRQVTRVQTHSYIFVNRVRWQKRPLNWPDSGINGQYIRFDVSREVTLDARYKDWIEKALLDLPSFSLVTDMENLFDPQKGIYVNAVQHGEEWERPASIELLNPDGSAGFQIDAGVRIRGGYSRHPAYPKHAFRLFFREDYGAAKLEYPLFGDEGVDKFDKIDLRCSQNYSWANGDVLDTGTRDVFSRDLQREMGQPYTRSRFYHLYLNGMYWGLYETQERSEASYAASYFGGSREDYDVVKVDAGYNRPYTIEATDGNLDAWRQVWEACNKGFKVNADYFALEGKKPDGTPDPAGVKLVDIDNLIDYMLVIFHTGNYDSPVSKFGSNKMPNNYYAIYNRVRKDGFKFFAHDNEHTLLIDRVNIGDGIEENRVNIGRISGDRKMVVNNFYQFHPQWLHFKLSENAEYRLRFADHVYRHYFNKGIFLPERSRELFLSRTRMLETAIIAESARWGDLTRSKYGSWEPVVRRIADEYFPERYDIVLQQYYEEGLYPTIDPPDFRLKGRQIIDEKLLIQSSDQIEFVNPNKGQSKIYYTLDGSDPRAVGGAVAPGALEAANQSSATIPATAVLAARCKSGEVWSALHKLTLIVPTDYSSLKITEIHYKPLPDGEVSGNEYEFLEFKNIGREVLPLGLVSIVKGVSYTFPLSARLAPGQFLCLASNAAAFKKRYGWEPFGEYEGQLDNSGERIVMVSAAGDTILSVRYNDKAPWPTEQDKTGRSLVARELEPSIDPNNPDYWRASYWVNGSPGQDDKIAADAAVTAQRFSYRFYRNSPNPFNSSTRIEFELAEAARVVIELYNLLGQRIRRPVDDWFVAGRHALQWEAEDLAAGVYLMRMETSTGFSAVYKVTLIK
ncbi:MAG: carbohydrate-binding protein [candidate division KSB1 bacterium]|nr:carbohydrate-binding protein [candidate division KSB1 bacterium]